MPINKDDFFVKSQITSNIKDAERIINTRVFTTLELRPFQEPSFVSLILKLNDLLQKLSILGHRVTFSEDVDSGDITDLVNKIRNAICHLDSPENLLDRNSGLKFVFNMIVGKVNAIAIGDDIVASSEYEDDIAFYYGGHRIYLSRHIVRLLEETKNAAKGMYPDDPYLLA
jgi:hypothetical protein